MDRLIAQIICELKHTQLCAGDISDGALAVKLGMSQSAFSASKHSGFGIRLLHDVAEALDCDLEVRFVRREGRN